MKTIRLRRRKLDETSDQQVSRITNETVAEHRERILAGGRRFKYPHQYVKHRLVINAILISLGTLILLIALGWWQLYKAGNTSDFAYRVTRIIPVPVADVSGERVRYSDYLLRYRSQELWIRSNAQQGTSSANDQRQLDFYKRRVMNGLLLDIYAEKRGHELNISVSDEEVDAAIESNRSTATGKISQEVYDTSIKDTYGYSPDEYRHILKQSLMRQKVSLAIDAKAREARDKVAAIVKTTQSKPDLTSVATTLKSQGIMVEVGGSGGLVSKDNHDYGLSQQAALIKVGQVSEAFPSTRGEEYYFVQKISETDRQTEYQYIRIPLTAFAAEFDALKKQGKIHEYISLST